MIGSASGIGPVSQARLLPAPSRMVVIGSSISAGYGATSRNGWCQQLATLMATRGWTSIQRGEDNSTSTLQLARFDRDVLSESPAVVVISASAGVDGLAGAASPETVMRTLIDNTRDMAKRALAAGAIPIIGGVTPKDAYTAAEHIYLKSINDALGRLGFVYWDMLNALDDGNGHYRSGYSADGIHPNDTGHAVCLRCCSPSQVAKARVPLPPAFDSCLGQGPAMLVADEGGSASGWVPMLIRLADTLSDSDLLPKDITVCTRVKVPSSSYYDNGWMALSLSTDTALRVRSLSSDHNLAVASGLGNLITATIDPIATRLWHHLALRYDQQTGVLTFFVDGASVGTTTLTAGQTCSAIAIGGKVDTSVPMEGSAWTDVSVHRCPLSNEQILSIANGVPVLAGCVYKSGPYRGLVHRSWPNLMPGGASALCDPSHLAAAHHSTVDTPGTRAVASVEVPLLGEVLFNAYKEGSTYKRRASGSACRLLHSVDATLPPTGPIGTLEVYVAGPGDAASTITWSDWKVALGGGNPFQVNGAANASIGYQVAGVQVVGAQQGVIDDPVATATPTETGGVGFASTEEFGTWTAEVQTVLMAILAAMRNHGLITEATP